MKIAFISDIHANLEALQAVLNHIDQEGVDLIVNLGDLVGYNANPRECLELVRERRVLSVMGNHDRAATEPRLAAEFNLIAHQAILWTNEELQEEHKQYLSHLPLTHRLEDAFLACHGTPANPEAYVAYHFQGKRLLNQLRRELAPMRICFFGHTHRQAVWYRDVRGKVATLPINPAEIVLSRENHYLINPGSVGQPRNRIPAASYAVFDTVDYTVSFHLLPYDIACAQHKILAANLHPYLAERLAQGV